MSPDVGRKPRWHSISNLILLKKVINKYTRGFCSIEFTDLMRIKNIWTTKLFRRALIGTFGYYRMLWEWRSHIRALRFQNAFGLLSVFAKVFDLINIEAISLLMKSWKHVSVQKI